MRNPLTERALTGVKGTAGNATGTSGCRLREGVPVAGWEPGTWWRQIGPSLLSSGGVACCDRKAAGEEEVPRSGNNLSGARGAAGEGGQHGLLVFKAKQDVRKDWPMPRQPAELSSAHACGSISR